jgi:hypothetical protein
MKLIEMKMVSVFWFRGRETYCVAYTHTPLVRDVVNVVFCTYCRLLMLASARLVFDRLASIHDHVFYDCSTIPS